MLYLVKYFDGDSDCEELMNEIQLDTAKHDWAIVIESIENISKKFEKRA